MWRSILAVATGFVLIGALSIGTDTLVRFAIPGAFDAGGRTDNVAILLLTIVYVGLYAISGCYLAARMAPDRPMRHAIALGLLGLGFNIVGTVMLWNTAPAWYHVTALALVMPWALIGGSIRERELSRASTEHDRAAIAA